MKCSFQAASFAIIAGVSVGNRAGMQSTAEVYEEFRRRHRAGGEADPVPYAERLALFSRRLDEVAELNARPGKTWVAGLTRFADATDLEFGSMLGYRRTHYHGGASSFLEGRARRGVDEHEVKPHRAARAATVDWSRRLSGSVAPLDQGGCGSCWAVAAIGALEMRAEVEHKKTFPLSYEEVVDCVQNPRHCGGKGHCEGATGELALQYVQEHGVVASGHYKGYRHGLTDYKCKTASQKSGVIIEGFRRLRENRLDDLMDAVESGPVVISVDAGGWQFYRGGVFGDCARNATVNHAVLLVGYGHDTTYKKDYWYLRNSWSHNWGIEGYMKLMRHNSDEWDAGYCGTDHKPQDGVGCDGWPSTISVCGMCGSLSDSVYPYGIRFVGSSAL